ncbi:NUDIX hydrolase [Croceicoccus bisphenolivorans]|uniref:NUDIX hydrolase n=1 Tax=Croceicoccus bisphenolivorans TaxID=1783232 RepID=UPI00155F899B|nr:NUDIX domain-containing protein [Croceicoccus bisphenolivorans]
MSETTDGTGQQPAATHPAASLIVFRNGPSGPELLMIRRSDQLAFGAGATVFPGGRVDPDDVTLARTLSGDPDWNAARIACVRETLEETGLFVGVTGYVDPAIAGAARASLAKGTSLGAVLDEHGLALDVEDFVPFARWHPPSGVNRRFDTRFLIADIGTGAVTLSADGTETSSQFWATAADLLSMGSRDEIRLMFPTRANLIRLDRLGDFSAARADSELQDVSPVSAFVEERDGERWLCVEPGHGYDGIGQPLVSAIRGETQQ